MSNEVSIEEVLIAYELQPPTDRFAELSLLFLIRCEVVNSLLLKAIENFELQLVQNPFIHDAAGKPSTNRDIRLR